MIEFVIIVAVLIGFGGGVAARAWRFEKKHQRWAAFLAPMTICALLLHVPVLLPWLIHMLRTRFGPLYDRDLKELAAGQFTILLVAFFLTGAGWVCAIFVQKVFEGEAET